MTIADSLKESMKNNYFPEMREKMKDLRNFLLKSLLNCKYDMNIWVPEVLLNNNS